MKERKTRKDKELADLLRGEAAAKESDGQFEAADLLRMAEEYFRLGKFPGSRIKHFPAPPKRKPSSSRR